MAATACVLGKLLWLPVKIAFVVTYKQTEHQSVGHTQQKPSALVAVSLSLDLGSVLREVDVRVLGQVRSRVPHVPERRVDEHQARFENVKVRLVAQDGAQPQERLHAPEVHARRAHRVLDEPEEAAHQDQRHAQVERGQRRLDGFGLRRNTGSEATVVEGGGEVGEDEDDGDLEREGYEDEIVAGLLGRVLCLGVGGEGDTRGVETLDQGHEAAEEGSDSGRVEGRGTWDVVEDSAEDMIVGEFKERTLVG